MFASPRKGLPFPLPSLDASGTGGKMIPPGAAGRVPWVSWVDQGAGPHVPLSRNLPPASPGPARRSARMTIRLWSRLRLHFLRWFKSVHAKLFLVVGLLTSLLTLATAYTITENSRREMLDYTRKLARSRSATRTSRIPPGSRNSWRASREPTRASTRSTSSRPRRPSARPGAPGSPSSPPPRTTATWSGRRTSASSWRPPPKAPRRGSST